MLIERSTLLAATRKVALVALRFNYQIARLVRFRRLDFKILLIAHVKLFLNLVIIHRLIENKRGQTSLKS
jgi:hypothetical protein